MSPTRRNFIRSALSPLIAGAAGRLWSRGDSAPRPRGGGGRPPARPSAFSFESLALNSLNYYERLVDAEGLPYFNVFWTKPAEAAHDWPDFGDVMSRQWKAAVMLRRMTGREAATERVWRRKVLSLIDPGDGLLHRPATSYSKPVADWGDASLTLYALVTAAVESGDDDLKRAAVRMAEGMLEGLRSGRFRADGFAIKPLMIAARFLGCEAGFEAARILVDRAIVHGSAFTSDNTFGAWGHMHGNLRSMVGAADYAAATRDRDLLGRMDSLYKYVKATGTSFGFLPEVVGRKGDIIACETCALMDYAGIGVTLANLGHPEYWGDMERLARNHYAESQVRDASWLESDNSGADTAQFTYRDIGPRVRGAWAGWSSPNHILACRETLNAHWGGPELKNKTRAFQNCCGGSGVHGLFILWKHSSRFEAGTLAVNMHLDKRLPQAEIRCEQPYRGLLKIALKQDGAVKVRIPDFTQAAEMRVRVNGAELPIAGNPKSRHSSAREGRHEELEPARPVGRFLELGRRRSGDRLDVAYPLSVRTEEVAVGNPGFRQWRYRVTWRGDTVVRLEPVWNEARTGYSDFDKAEVEVFYGEEGPGRLYRRDGMWRDVRPSHAELHPDDGGLDFWKIT